MKNNKIGREEIINEIMEETDWDYLYAVDALRSKKLGHNQKSLSEFKEIGKDLLERFVGSKDDGLTSGSGLHVGTWRGSSGRCYYIRYNAIGHSLLIEGIGRVTKTSKHDKHIYEFPSK